MHYPDSQHLEPVLVSKPMIVRADQLMLHDVVTNDGDLGTVFRLEAQGCDITVWFHDGRMAVHEFFVLEHEEVSIVRPNQES